MAQLAVFSLYAVQALANPQGPQVANGQVSFSSPQPKVLNITNTPGAIINWASFGIHADETTRFIQHNPASAVLNRVTGQNPSALMGQLLSNGRVFLINRNGIVFGPNAVIDTAGLVASTLNITDQDFIAGNLKFQGEGPAGAIRNQGYIKVGANGSIFLIAPNIENSGIIETDGGQLVLAAGQRLVIASLDSDHIVFDVQAPDNEVVNLGALITHGGAAAMFAGTIRHSGVVNANSVSVDTKGQVRFSAKADIALETGSQISASGPQGGSVTINAHDGEVRIAGAIATIGDENGGGSIKIGAYRVALDVGAKLDASGETGGGTVHVGGGLRGAPLAEARIAEQVEIAAGTSIHADALGAGAGGEVVLWSQRATRFRGNASVRGGPAGGDGGLVETSSHAALEIALAPDVSAPAGDAGTWLIDPSDISIVAGGAVVNATGVAPFTSTGDGARIGVDLITAALTGGANVSITTANVVPSTEVGNISLDAPLELDATTGTNTLTLSAANDVLLRAPVRDTVEGGQRLNLVLIADNDSSGAGVVEINNDIDTGGAGVGSGSITATAGAGRVRWRSGTLRNTGLSTHNLEVSGPAEKRLDAAYVQMDGSDSVWSDGNIVLANNSTLRISDTYGSSGTFTIATDGRIEAGSGASSGRIVSYGGTIIKSGTPGTASIEVYLDNSENRSAWWGNSGTVSVADGSGTLRLQGGGRARDKTYYRAYGDGVIEFAGEQLQVIGYWSSYWWNFYIPGRMTINGDVRLTGGTLLISNKNRLSGEELNVSGGELVVGSDDNGYPSVRLGTVQFTGGHISGAGSIASVLEWSGGEFGGPGAGTVRGQIDILPGAPKSVDGWTLINTGAGSWGATTVSLSGNATLDNQGVLNLAKGASALSGDASILSIDNSGTLIGPVDGRVSLNVPVHNTGSVEDAGGVLGFDAGYLQSGIAAATVLAGGRIEGALRIEGGNFGGPAGTVAGSLDNFAGNLLPGGHRAIGTLVIEGDFTQGAGGRIEAEIDASAADRITVSGPATLGGTLLIESLDPYTTSVGDVLTPLSYASRSGSFAVISGGYGDEINVDYGSPLTLTVIGKSGAFTWQGGGTLGDWFDPVNWAGGTVPGVGDDVWLDAASGPVTITGSPATVQRLRTASKLIVDGTTLSVAGTSVFSAPITVLDGSLDGIGDIETNAALVIDGANLSGAHTTRLLTRGASSFSGKWDVERRVVENEGQMTWSMPTGPYTGPNVLDAELINRPGARLDINGWGVISGSGHITNEGLLRSSGPVTASLGMYIPVNNTLNGTIEVASSLYLDSGGANAGRWQIEPGAMLHYSGILEVLPSTTIEATGDGTGFLDVGGGLELLADLHFNGNARIGGAKGFGALVLSGSVNLSGTYRSTGNLTTTGEVYMDNDFHLVGSTWRNEGYVEHQEDDVYLHNGAVWENLGRIYIADDDDDAEIVVDATSQIHNLPGGEIELDYLDDGLYGGGSLLNEGTLYLDDPISLFVDNRGRIEMSYGWLGEVDNNNGGTINVNVGNLSIGVLNNQGGTVRVTAGSALTITGLATVDSRIEVASGATMTFNDITMSGDAELAGAGNFIFNSGMSVSGEGAEIAVGTTVNLAGQSITGTGTLTNLGTITAVGISSVQGPLRIGSSGSLLLEGSQDGPATLFTSGSLENLGSIILTSPGGAGDSTLSVGGDGVLTNSGLIQMLPGAGGVWRIDADVNSDGDLDASAAPLVIGTRPLVIGTGGASDFQTTPTSGVVLIGHTLAGVGTVKGDLHNISGTLTPGASPGVFTVTGNYVQSAGGTLLVELGGTTPGAGHDVLAVSGTATLAGTLQSSLWGGFVPAPGDVFDVLTASSVVNDFSTFIAPPTQSMSEQGFASFCRISAFGAAPTTAVGFTPPQNGGNTLLSGIDQVLVLAQNQPFFDSLSAGGGGEEADMANLEITNNPPGAGGDEKQEDNKKRERVRECR